MRRTGYLLLLPSLAALLIVEAYPLAQTILLSLTDFNTGSFVGVASYSQFVTDGYFVGSALTSLVYAFGSTALAFMLGLAFAFQISTLKKGKRFLESVLLAPLATAPIFAGILWSPSGVWDDLDTFWHFVLGQPFFNSASTGFFFPVMVLSDAWEWFPLFMLVSLGIMGSVPKEVYEAAEVSGASAWQTFRKIGSQAVFRSPVMQFVVVIRFIDALRAFEIPFNWSTWISLPQAGSPVDTISLLLFKLFTLPIYNFPIGEISAMAVTLLILTLASTLVLFSLMRRYVR